MFHDFLAQGLCVIPLNKGIPVIQWGRYFHELPTASDVDAWPKSQEYALVCGKVSGVVALDIDTDDTARIEALAGASPVKKYGSKGFTAFYRYSGEGSHVWKRDGAVICELLSDKRLTTIPPSPHRITGKPYTWEGGVGLLDIHQNDLPALPDDFITIMDAKFPRPAQTYTPRSSNYDAHENLELAQVVDMLEFIDPGCARDEWIQIGMALRDEFGDLACDTWHRWSAKSQKYEHRQAQSAWKSFSQGAVTIGTLVYRAQQGGFVFPRDREAEEGFSVDLSYIFSQRPATPADTATPLQLTGLVGDIAEWITNTAIRPQPVLSLAAALTFMGAIKGHRIRGHTNLRTNLMCLSLAPTAAGKEHPQMCIDRLMDAVGLRKNIMGRPTSGTALLTGINKAGGVALLTVDEMGRYIGNITLKSAGGYQREIADYMVELFSSASRTFRGRQYANEKENPQVVINQPHFCCLGSTVPERLQAACSSAEVIDGFLNRWLVFTSEVRPEKQQGVKHTPPPQELIDKIIYWMAENPVVNDNYGTPDPKEMRFTPEAWDMLVAFDKRMMQLLDSEPYPLNQLYARSGEHAEKLAMVLCDDMNIGVKELEMAIAIVEQSNRHINSFASSISDNQHEADVLYVLNVIKKWPDIGRNQLTRMTRKIPHRLRGDIVAQLIESGEVEATSQGKRTSYRFSAV